jgi:hypothetical protein
LIKFPFFVNSFIILNGEILPNTARAVILFLMLRMHASRKLLGLHHGNHRNWKNHIEQMIHKLSEACYAVRTIVHISNAATLKSMYFSHLHSIIKYGINPSSNSCNSRKIFTLQEKMFRIMVRAKPRLLHVEVYLTC